MTGPGLMTPRVSAALLLYRVAEGGDLEVLVGHMGGPYWANKEAGAWTIPKGEPAAGEDPHATAVREFAEEVGLRVPEGPEIDLGTVRQRGGKTVMAWARCGDVDVSGASSNLFELEWPPHSGRTRAFPELDRVRWLPVDHARGLVVSGQVELLDRLLAALAHPAG